ncbi:MAG: hypothetical protein FWF97_00765 [Alphaproteobacteria bacterium]|nr:hypothetical protein [Alphaproteobacteria bacterium]
MRKIALTSLVALFAVGTAHAVGTVQSVTPLGAGNTSIVTSQNYVHGRIDAQVASEETARKSADGDLQFTGAAASATNITAAINLIEAGLASAVAGGINTLTDDGDTIEVTDMTGGVWNVKARTGSVGTGEDGLVTGGDVYTYITNNTIGTGDLTAGNAAISSTDLATDKVTVVVDGSSVNVGSSGLEVKAGGITSTHFNTSNVTTFVENIIGDSIQTDGDIYNFVTNIVENIDMGDYSTAINNIIDNNTTVKNKQDKLPSGQQAAAENKVAIWGATGSTSGTRDIINAGTGIVEDATGLTTGHAVYQYGENLVNEVVPGIVDELIGDKLDSGSLTAGNAAISSTDLETDKVTVVVDGSSVNVGSSGLEVKAGGITEQHFNSSVDTYIENIIGETVTAGTNINITDGEVKAIVNGDSCLTLGTAASLTAGTYHCTVSIDATTGQFKNELIIH